MAAAFLAMNEVFGPVFDVSARRGPDAGRGRPRAGALAEQFILDAQTHFVRDDFNQEGLLGLAKYAKQNWNPALGREHAGALQVRELREGDLRRQRHQGRAALGRALRRPDWDLLTNDQIAAARQPSTGSPARAGCSATRCSRPSSTGWLDEVDRASPRSSPTAGRATRSAIRSSRPSCGSYWRLDDEKLIYPFYEKIVKAGIRTVCIHKGLLPADYETSWPDVWQYDTVWDVGKAAKDWPQLNFVIYHGALRPFLETPDARSPSSSRPAA